MSDYEIKLAAFEGPMDLLMHLIDKNKIDIYDIPIAQLTAQYLEYLEQVRKLDMELTSSFLVMAATLLLIKSRMMLPKPSKETEEDEEDPRMELVRRILEYRKIKAVSEQLGEMAGIQERYVAREPMELPLHHLPPEQLSLEDLQQAFLTVLEVKQDLTIPEALVEPEEYSIQGKMTDIVSLLHRNEGRANFLDVFHHGGRSELIMSFLALLELMKQHVVKAEQNHTFGRIEIVLAPAPSGGPGQTKGGGPDTDG